jgi:hypothetical protein
MPLYDYDQHHFPDWLAIRAFSHGASPYFYWLSTPVRPIPYPAYLLIKIIENRHGDHHLG